MSRSAHKARLISGELLRVIKEKQMLIFCFKVAIQNEKLKIKKYYGNCIVQKKKNTINITFRL